MKAGSPARRGQRSYTPCLLQLCSLPFTCPGNRLPYKSVNGPYELIMIAGGDN